MMRPAHVIGFTALAMLAFAANSLLCRAALRTGSIDAASFTAVRLASGALVLWLLLALRANAPAVLLSRRALASGALLFAYAAGFSFAYLALGAATGALILFATVQLCMLVAGLAQGERPSPHGWLGVLLASAGLVGLLLPGVTAPPLGGALMMTLAGIAWAAYSMLGRAARDPLQATASNFVAALPCCAVLLALAFDTLHLSASGAMLALVSGALASGVGYVIWYRALPGLSATQASTVQLSVPPLAAVGAVVLLGEALHLRLIVAGAAILLGIGLVMLRSARR